MPTPRLRYSLVLAFALASGAQAAEAPSAKTPRLVVHLLDYLAKDYAGAVGPGGKLISASEFAEQQEFGKTTVTASRELPELQGHAEILGGLEELNTMIAAKAEPAAVATKAKELQAQIIAATHLMTEPAQTPDPKHGHAVFTAQCVVCHGPEGHGDGPGSAGLEPKPANLTDAERMRGLSALHVFDSVRIGIPGTSMPAFPQLSDQDTWDLASYVLTLSGGQAASPSDQQTDSLARARSGLRRAATAYGAGQLAQAKSEALAAYLEGIEPIEPRLRASDPEATALLESKMAAVRSAFERRADSAEVAAAMTAANEQLERAQEILAHKDMSPSVAFVAASSVLLREGFEAVLMILALLGVIRASGSKRAALWVHAGWISALGCGVVAWFSSGYLLELSGAGRETMEAVTSLIAVAVLLAVGFWLHSRTEIGRWNHFIKVKVKGAMANKNHFGLASIAFIAVFRECFETVLFLRAIWIDSGDSAKTALLSGVGLTLAGIIVASWMVLRFSAHIPVRKLFAASAVVMAVLAFILTGKGLHSLQETGLLSVTTPRLTWRWELLGLFPTYETLAAQVLLLLLMGVLWSYGKRPSPSRVRARSKSPAV